MRWNGYRNVLVGTIMAMCALAYMPAVTAYASGGEVAECSLLGAEYTNDGGVTHLSNDDEGTLTVTFDTRKEEAGYYTSFLSLQKKYLVRKGEVVRMKVSTKEAVRMNVNLIDKVGNVYACEDESSVYLKWQESEAYTICRVTDGTIEVPEEFTGELYFPASEEIASEKVAFIFVQEGGRKSRFSIDGVSILEKSHKVSKMVDKKYGVQGKSDVLIPSNGEYTYQYVLTEGSKKRQSAKVSLSDQVSGVTVTEDGTLSILDTAKQQKVTLLFTKDGDQFAYQVNIVRSWYMEHEEENFLVPKEEEVAAVSAGFMAGKEEALGRGLRMALLIGSIGYACIYIIRIRKGR